MTDPHIFDAGGARHAEGVAEEALDNRAAFNWAILETNRLVLAEHRTIDFVVITGDAFAAEIITSWGRDPTIGENYFIAADG